MATSTEEKPEDEKPGKKKDDLMKRFTDEELEEMEDKELADEGKTSSENEREEQ
jgi:hypothetical protein